MKIESKQNSYEVYGEVKTQKFRIDDENMGLVYKSFLNYSNPIGSLVRELTSNSFDSHQEAGIDLPVTVKISNGNKLIGETAKIHFIDYGVGLSPERVENVFCKFFTSTKRDTNNLIGGFGIGAKSPLAYVDMFYIYTNYEGKHYIYSVNKGEESPEMSLIDISDTTEGNGTEVIVNIKETDIPIFIREIKNQLKYFDNIQYINCDMSDYRIIKDGHFIRNTSSGDYDLDICIGRVRYPLDTSIVYPNELRLLRGVGLYFDIGEIEVVWNRENIYYTEKTIAKITERISEAIAQIHQKVTVANSKTYTFDDIVKSESVTIPFEICKRAYSIDTFSKKPLNCTVNGETVTHQMLRTIVSNCFQRQGYPFNNKIAKINSYANPINDFAAKRVIYKDIVAKPINNHTLYKLFGTNKYIYSFADEIKDVSKYTGLSEKTVKAITDKFISEYTMSYDITITDKEKQDYKDYLDSIRVKKTLNTSKLNVTISSDYGTWTSTISLEEMANRKHTRYIIFPYKDKENAITVSKALSKLYTHDFIVYNVCMIFSQENTELVLSAKLDNVIYYTDFLKLPFFEKVAQRIADYEVLGNARQLYSELHIVRHIFDKNGEIQKALDRTIKSMKYTRYVQSTDLLILPEPSKEYVEILNNLRAFKKWLDKNKPLIWYLPKPPYRDSHLEKEIHWYFSSIKPINIKYYDKLSQNPNNEEQ